jgi:ER-bound oxygenase mpaB/B'/Rubber oxygenase, catalytic domain
MSFVEKDSIVRKIWGKSDTILFIFAGAAAEFALNKAVDWLYFTGRLPKDPLGRLFSTVTYARLIVFSENDQALKAIDAMRQIHTKVEENRAQKIPDWAYRDVLYMLIHYSIASFELLERKLSQQEKQEVFDVFFRVGARMGLKDLPVDYEKWTLSRNSHLENDMHKSEYTIDLFKQYKKHLGGIRYFLLIQGQKLVVPPAVQELLGFNSFSFLSPIIPMYKFSRLIKLDSIIKSAILPREYAMQIKNLDVCLPAGRQGTRHKGQGTRDKAQDEGTR